MKFLFLFILFLALRSPLAFAFETFLTQSPLLVEKVMIPGNPNTFRAGIYLERREVAFKGCVIYLEGLADSVMNQTPLYEALSLAGYRTVFFDYMGQGGSSGSMGDTRLEETGVYFANEIGYQARQMWLHFSSEKDPVYGRSCEGSLKRVIGWSTGGLAAYKLANERWADAVALIAPGINPKTFVGASEGNALFLLAFRPVITMESLTRNDFKGTFNPHQDPIFPTSPFHVLPFSLNLLEVSKDAQLWTIDPKIRGLLMVGTADSYVDPDALRRTIDNNASHFQFQTYPGAAHELANEMPDVANDVRTRIINFFDGR
jgi:alpha-beta hydrolase superfamily lysophospholipase